MKLVAEWFTDNRLAFKKKNYIVPFDVRKIFC